MTTLHIIRGLPGSGKTTFATSWVREDPDNRTRVNRDDLRQMMFGKRADLLPAQEALVTAAEQAIVRSSLEAGRDTIVDDMNLRPRYVRG